MGTYNKRTHILSCGSKLSTRELCDKIGVPMQWACNQPTEKILNYHNRKRKTAFALDGETASAEKWAEALKITPNQFRDTVYTCERHGATREEAMLITVRHFRGDRKFGALGEKVEQLHAAKRDAIALKKRDFGLGLAQSK